MSDGNFGVTTTPGVHYVVIPIPEDYKYWGAPTFTHPIDSVHALDFVIDMMSELGIASLQVYTLGYPINERLHVERGLIPATSTERPAFGYAPRCRLA